MQDSTKELPSKLERHARRILSTPDSFSWNVMPPRELVELGLSAQRISWAAAGLVHLARACIERLKLELRAESDGDVADFLGQSRQTLCNHLREGDVQAPLLVQKVWEHGFDAIHLGYVFSSAKDLPNCRSIGTHEAVAAYIDMRPEVLQTTQLVHMYRSLSISPCEPHELAGMRIIQARFRRSLDQEPLEPPDEWCVKAAYSRIDQVF